MVGLGYSECRERYNRMKTIEGQKIHVPPMPPMAPIIARREEDFTDTPKKTTVGSSESSNEPWDARESKEVPIKIPLITFVPRAAASRMYALPSQGMPQQHLSQRLHGFMAGLVEGLRTKNCEKKDQVWGTAAWLL
jgi:hypothetical protein